MTAPVLDTALCRLTGVRHPVVQTGMGWVAGPRLVSATAEAGALGVLASATMSLEQLESAIREVRERTGNPFGVNLRADAADAEQRVDLLIREGVRVASFALMPDQRLIGRLKDADVVVIPSVGARRHAEKVRAWGADAVLVQGGEGGGHTGPVATTVLLPQVVDAVDIPVIAAGGFFDGRGLAAALCYGAAGIGMGTRFLLTSDSAVPDAVKQRYLAAAAGDAQVTSRVDGMPHRMLRSALTESAESTGRLRRLPGALRHAAAFKAMSGMSWRRLIADGLAMRRAKEMPWSAVLLAANTPMLIREALVRGDADAGVLPAGQVVGLLDELPGCAELVEGIVEDAARVLAGSAGLVSRAES
ncbi:nitronate monooxygenase [Saccharopolyspora gloriosae]|uniref:NAD(P)H-dependent flavin oxidoreductase YrpB (Nitropropane dioxygenase family) n=1 Tax=Saccharopolyspora gloriosae TaxID=455344 RepID=A0A840NH28_9PSEU|nr:nitronate monooxygenase [Saccharopolyspora gloriosae]MBB5069385.1 NAD(P)H-dependent flavin oxidoreductase YrpB (nitropropane dioxygenase family) [Saccharopolyspora gloriosae]